MKILLDECVDRRFARELPEHSVETVSSMDWTGTLNGELLRKAEQAGFEVFITVDRNLAFQQNLHDVKLGVVVMSARSNRLADLVPLAQEVLRTLTRLKKGEISRVPDQSSK